MVPWLLFLGHLVVDTILLGMVSVAVPQPSDVEAVGWPGQTATVLIRLSVAAGALTALGSIALPAFRPRELFNGTVRQLADRLWTTDISDDYELSIHRVAVVKPLDEREVLTFSKRELLERLGSGKVRPAARTNTGPRAPPGSRRGPSNRLRRAGARAPA